MFEEEASNIDHAVNGMKDRPEKVIKLVLKLECLHRLLVLPIQLISMIWISVMLVVQEIHCLVLLPLDHFLVYFNICAML